MSLVGLDVNATRARAVSGPASQNVALLRLDSDQVELPLALSLEGKQPQVGRAGFALSRARPHLACLDFLPHLGSDKVWNGGLHRVPADRACELTFQAMAKVLGRSAGLSCVLPAYLHERQIEHLYRLSERVGLPLTGSLSHPLAAVLASPILSCSRDPGLILVVDVDGHALTWSIVERSTEQIRLRMMQTATHLSRGIWLRRLLDGASNRCVRQSRRDPRESGETEQGLYEQLVHLIEKGPPRLAQLHVQGTGWFFHLLLHAEELAALVAPLLHQVLSDLDAILTATESLGTLQGVVVTHSASGLPGLVAVLQARLQSRVHTPSEHEEQADYGDLLLRAAETEKVHVLPIDAPACVAHELALRIHRKDFPRGHLDAVALPKEQGENRRDLGPARLSFRGTDHVLNGRAFTLGRDPTCDLVFESELYPHVSARHCEIIFAHQAYVLRDCSRHGTLLNDRPMQQPAALHSGDWIRLGPNGPLLRFLGETTRQG